MTTAVVIVFLASFLWAIVNHMDKYMLCKIDSSTSNVRTLLVFSTFVAGLVLAPIGLVISKFQIGIDLLPLMIVFCASILNASANYFYFKAMEKIDASIVVVMFQLIPVFSFALSFLFFGEMLSVNEILGALIIILSAVMISIDFGKVSQGKKAEALILVIASSLLFSLYYVCFDFAMRNAEYIVVAFWFQIGLLLIGIGLLSLKSFRTAFIAIIKSNGNKFVSINITSEVLNVIADLMIHFANLTMPLALVNTLCGFQGGFCFMIGAIGTVLFPKIIREDLDKKNVIQKLLCIILGISGLAVMFN